MSTSISRNGNRGFSLIEVLIAVVVLSFGLLALAALQTRLIRASSDAKAQSIALALAKGRLEEMRSFECISGCANSYQGLTSGTEDADDSSGSLGGTNFDVSWTVRRFALANGATTFTELTGASASGAVPAGYRSNSEFKTIDVRVAWTDAGGASQTVAMEDAVAGLDPNDTSRSRNSRTGSPRGPKVVIVDPSTDTGVIPIAVGENSDTAATNPKPVNVSRSGQDDAVETRFDVLTYAALSGGVAQAQSRVETTVVGCTCTRTAQTAKGYRPTYWNGFRYVAPQQNTSAAPARAASGVTQSRYCDACCRDHHDDGFSGPKFSPRRAAHTHYKKLPDNTLAVAGANENYLEACRLIRVDGIFNVAADLSNDYYNLLATGSNADSPQPSTANPDAVTNYQTFVLAYLEDRYVEPSPSSGFESGVFNNRTNPAPAAIAAANSLDLPATIEINPLNGQKWLHSRGLYIDYLEQSALDAIGDAKENCPGTNGANPTAQQLRDCVLKVLPFTSINLTELASWAPIAGQHVKVTATNDFDTSIAFNDPIRGKVTPGTNPQNNQTQNVTTFVTSSNSGVAVSDNIDPDDAASASESNMNDAQAFLVQSGAGGQPGGTFNLLVTNYLFNTSNLPETGYTYSGRNDICSATANSNPFVCATRSGEPLPSNMMVRVGNYNRSGSDTILNPCRNSGTTEMPYRTVYDVTAVASSNLGASIGPLTVPSGRNDMIGTISSGGEYTEFAVSPIANGDVLTVLMSAPRYLCPSNYPNPGGNLNQSDGESFQCSGNGSNRVPTWSTTYVNCPNPLLPPNFP